MAAGMVRLEDTVRALDAEARASLRDGLAAQAARLGADIGVLVVQAVPGRAFRQHATGSRRELGVDLLLVLSIEDRHAELATDPRWAARCHEAAVSGMLRATLVPELRAGRIAAGIEAGVAGAVDLCSGCWSAADQDSSRPVSDPGPRTVGLIVAALFLTTVGIGSWMAWRSGRCPQCGSGMRIERTLASGPEGAVNGCLQVTRSCRACTYSQVSIEAPRPSSSSSDDDGGSSGWSSDSGSDSGSSDGGGGADW